MKPSAAKTIDFKLALLALIVVTAFCFYFKQVFMGHVLFQRDYVCYLYPALRFGAESIQRGEIPLWYPYNDCGVPMLATWNLMMLYPPYWLYFAVPHPATIGLITIAHCVAAGWLTFALTRRWGLSPPACGLAAIGFAFSGTCISGSEYISPQCALACLPALLLLTDRLMERPNRRDFALASLVWSLQLLAGQPELCYYSGLIVAPYAVVMAALKVRSAAKGRPPATPSGMLFRLFVVGATPLVGVLLTSVQLLPSMELYQISVRAKMPKGHSENWFFTVHDFLRMLNPEYFTRLGPSWISGGKLQRYIYSPYMSVIVSALAIVGVGVRRWRARFILIACVVMMWASAGSQAGIWHVVKSLPGTSFFRFPAKIFQPAAFLFPVLAAFGLDAVLASEGKSRRRLSAGALLRWAVLPATAVASLLLGAIALRESRTDSIRMAHALAPAAAAVAFWFALRACRSGKRDASRSAPAWLALLVIVGGDLWIQNARIHPTVRESVIHKAGNGLRRSLEPVQRILFTFQDCGKMRKYLPPTPEENARGMILTGMCWTNKLADVYSVAGYGPSIPLNHYFMLLFPIQEMAGEPMAEKVFDALGISHRLHLEEGTRGMGLMIDKRPHPLPRARIVTRMRQMSADEALRTIHSGKWQPESEALVASSLPPDALEGAEGSVIEEQQFECAHLRLVVNGEGGLLVLSDVAYPDWQTRLDGWNVETLVVNCAFRGCLVPPGRHVIDMDYCPRSVILGALISLAGLGFIGVLAFMPPPRAPKPPISEEQ